MQYNDNIPQLFLNDFNLSNYIKYSDRVYIHREVDINTPVYHYMDYIYLIEMLEKNLSIYQIEQNFKTKGNMVQKKIKDIPFLLFWMPI